MLQLMDEDDKLEIEGDSLKITKNCKFEDEFDLIFS
jgi:hypothetical protein